MSRQQAHLFSGALGRRVNRLGAEEALSQTSIRELYDAAMRLPKITPDAPASSQGS